MPLLTYNHLNARVFKAPPSIDSSTIHRLGKDITDSAADVVLDCRFTDYIDVTGFRWLMNIQEKQQYKGKDMALVNVTGDFLRLLSVLHANHLLQIYDDIESYITHKEYS
ncbi:STAS domain-containing protein [Endozoicomonas sp. SM1973]|uniref:STAS domain-containing protein n=1 Tax=Spartinivicinus marinus TaxID=2994442 RepID=A0A853I5Q4_9GAMM|nr:STAS domain-containing protein [Spartinivicinus marinus]MCX4029687.1 STAS domain-containing protein [Spartinivicinus marinus]NYZ66932.1 STAS domain-containing protein [Spartinivicinus marinus]